MKSKVNKSYIQLLRTLTIWNSIIKRIEGLVKAYYSTLMMFVITFCRKIWFQCSVILYFFALALCTEFTFIIIINFLCDPSAGEHVQYMCSTCLL